MTWVSGLNHLPAKKTIRHKPGPRVRIPPSLPNNLCGYGARTEFSLPTLMLNANKNSIFEMTMQDIHLENYQSHGQIKAAMAV